MSASISPRHAYITVRAKPIPFAPDLAVEVASPSQAADDMVAQARQYLRGGTRLVWIIWPERRVIDVRRPGRAGQPVVMLRLGDALDGVEILHGFTLPVAAAFADPPSTRL